MKIMKKLKAHLRDADKRRRIIVGSGVFITGFACAALLSILQAPKYATGQQMEDARRTIAEQFINESSVQCSDTSDPISPTGRIVVFYKYLRVNRYADRAVIRGCNNIDSLLAKKSDGTWVKTDVNMALDARVSTRWQSACNIADITIADDTLRSENTSIDETNFQLCMQLLDL